MAAATAAMLAGPQTCQLRSVRGTSCRFAPLLPAVSRRCTTSITVAHANRADDDLQRQVVKAVALSSVVGSFLAANNANAAVEIAQLAVSDNRLSILATLFVPAIGWVLFNIGQPALKQLSDMGDKNGPIKGKARRGVAVGLGLTAASMLAAQQADAVTEIAQLAATDNRLFILAGLFVPAIGWVLFNIGQPALKQFSDMGDKKPDPKSKGKGKRGVAVGLGLTAASMLAVQQADAVTEIAQLAATDNRIFILAGLFVPAIGWVLFNIGQPALKQFSDMGDKKPDPKSKGKGKRGVAVGLGLTAASMLAVQQADAASEIAQLAATDSRFGIIAGLFLPALGWVAFNIAEGLNKQLSDMKRQ